MGRCNYDVKEKLPCQRLRWGKNRRKGAVGDIYATIRNIQNTNVMSIVIISIDVADFA